MECETQIDNDVEIEGAVSEATELEKVVQNLVQLSDEESEKQQVSIVKNVDKQLEDVITDSKNVESDTNAKMQEKEEAELLSAVLNQKSLATPLENQSATPVRNQDKTLKVTNSILTADTAEQGKEAAMPAAEVTNDVEKTQESDIISHIECLAQQEQLRLSYEQQLEQMRAAIAQKDSMIALFQRENSILEKEKQAFRKEKEFANKEKESIVIKFAMKEKLLIDAKKEKEAVEKQLADAKKEIKNISTRFQAVNEEKSRMTYVVDEKCNEVRKYQRECEKLKTDLGHLESKLKYHVNKLNLEIEAKVALEKKLEEERNAPNKLEEKANEKLKMEYEANSILLKHEIARKVEVLENLTKEHNKSSALVEQLKEQLSNETAEKNQLCNDYELLQEEHNSVQNAYSEEMLNSAKLRGQLDELQVLKTQNTLNEEKLRNLNETVKELEERLQENTQDLTQLQQDKQELLDINKEMSESIVTLQNEICLLKAKAQGIEADNVLMKKEQAEYDTKYLALEQQLKKEEEQKSEERQLLAKHLSEKTKMYEVKKMELENVLGDFEATKNKHATVVKELQREIQKYKKLLEQTRSGTASAYCSSCRNGINGFNSENSESSAENATQLRTHSRSSSQSVPSSSRRASESSESETVVSNATAIQNDLQGPSKKHLVERILRLQQASARQAEKIDFLENHTLSLVAELQKKSKVVQYYMLRDQAGALTSSKSDQNKSELAKYGNGVMSAIYNGIKGENKSMTLELSLEINKKLQAVLEDTLLKNITLKENLDVLGLEVDNLTRKLRQLEAKE